MTELTAFAPGLYAAHDLLKAGVHWPLRSVIVDTGEGLWVHSPVAPREALLDEVRSLGEVRWIVSGSRFHHLFLEPWAEQFPKAELWPCEALRRARPTFPGLPALYLEGAPRVDEVVFHHEASRTLVVTDLIFNVHDTKSLVTRVVLGLARAFGRPAQSRLYRGWTKDRDAFRAGVEAILEWDFDRILMAHGEPIEANGRAVLEEACAWVLEQKRAA